MRAITSVTVPPDWHIFRVNDSPYWREDIREKCDAIWTVYAFDRASHTHLCESTPSYTLWWIGYEPEVKETVEGEDAREAVYEAVWEAGAEPVDYMHVSSVERLIEAHPERLNKIDLRDVLDDDETAEDLSDAILADRIHGAYNEGRIA